MAKATPKVTEVTVQEWIDALKSGKFKQTDGVLFNKSSYCCLGVLCRIGKAKFHSDENNGGYGPSFWTNEEGLDFFIDGTDLFGATLNSFNAAERRFKTRKEFEVKGENGRTARITFNPGSGYLGYMYDFVRPTFNTTTARDVLINLNDRGFTFEEIATLIPKLFRTNATIEVSTKR